MEIDTLQNIGLLALGFAFIYLIKQKEKIDVLEERIDKISKHMNLDIEWRDR